MFFPSGHIKIYKIGYFNKPKKPYDGSIKKGKYDTMRTNHVKKTVQAAMLAALVFAATYAVKIPSPTNGYVNLGDCFVLTSGWLLGPWYGAAAAGIGSALTDLLAGYPYYVPGTLVIKAADAFVAAVIYRSMKKSFKGMLAGGIAGELVMVAGYFGFSSLILGKGLSAALSISGNLVQGAVGITLGILIMQVAKRTNLTERL